MANGAKRKPQADGDESEERAESPGKLVTPGQEEELDEDEREFRALNKNIPGVKGSAAIGIVTIAVAKTPAPKNEFFRVHPDFRPTLAVVDLEVGMDRQFFAVTPSMENALGGIGITVTDHTLYLAVTPRGGVRIVPIPVSQGEPNEYNRSKELSLIRAIDEWGRIYTDRENHCYMFFPAPAGRFSDPIWPQLKPAKINRLAFRDKGRLIDSVEHPVFKKWAARDKD